MNTPPVDGWRATSPREVEKVDRSSWANFEGLLCQLKASESIGRGEEWRSAGVIYIGGE